MKRNILKHALNISAILYAFIFTAWAQPCNASFNLNIDSITGQLTVYKLPKVDSFSYSWQLNGTTVSNSYYYFNKFNTPGGHKICLTVVNPKDSSCQDTKCDSFYILFNQNTQCFARFFDSLVGPAQHNFLDMSGGNNISSWHWNFGDGTTSTTSNGFASKTYTVPGVYTVCLTIVRASDSCTSTTCKTITFATGLHQLHPSISGLQVYPVPFREELNLQLMAQREGPALFRLTDLTGRTVMQQDIRLGKDENKILLQLPQLPEGVYTMQLSTDEGSIYRQLMR